jgi:hypothetical protein
MRKFVLIVIAAAGMTTAAVSMKQEKQANCCGDPVCWPCFLGLQAKK